MKDLLAMALIAAGAWWLWTVSSEREQNLMLAELMEKRPYRKGGRLRDRLEVSPNTESWQDGEGKWVM